MNPKFTRIISLFILLSLFATNKVSASHFAAVDLHADYIGTGPGELTYRITLTIYKACEFASAADLVTEESVHIRSLSTPFTMTCVCTSLMSDTLDQLCPVFSSLNSCRSMPSVYPGFVRRIYTGIVTVPQASRDLTFWWQNGARNYWILNLANPSALNIYVSCGINNVTRYNNSSPRYTVMPIPYLCVNQPVQFYNYPSDPDNDSLLTIQKDPEVNMGMNAVYASGYSTLNPVASTTGYSVDSQTGTAAFTATTTGKYVVAFKTLEFDRNTGEMTGFITRDVQMSVLSCNAIPPVFQTNQLSLTGGTVSAADEITGNTGTPLSFDIKAVTASGNAIVGAVVSTLPTGANVTITQSSIDRVNFHFSWTPGVSDTGSWILTFKATDTTCSATQPVILTSYYSMALKVNRPLAVSSFNRYSAGVFPNPAKDILNINAGKKTIDALAVFNITGQKIINIRNPASTIDISQLIPGFYTVKILSNKETSIATFTKN